MLNKIARFTIAFGLFLGLTTNGMAQNQPPVADPKKVEELKKALGSLNIDMKTIKNEAVVLKVGDKSFTAVEVAANMSQILSAAQQTMGPEFVKTLTPEILFLIAREQLIDQYLIQKAVDADKKNLEKDPAVQEALVEAQNRVLQEAYVKNKADEYVTKTRIREKYEEFSNQFPKDAEEVRLRMIILKTEDEAKKVIDMLNKGGDFLKLAREMSIDKATAQNDGDLGYINEFTKASLPKDFDIIFEKKDGKPVLATGTYTKTAVKTPMGYVILKAEDRRPLKKPKLSELEPILKEVLRQKAVEEMANELKKKAGTIERLHPNTGKPMSSLEDELKAIQAKLGGNEKPAEEKEKK